MKEASKAEFKEMYFKHGGERDGWSASYWEQFYENPPKPMKYQVEEPPSPEHTRMMIVSDAAEHRLFFMTEEAEESFFGR